MPFIWRRLSFERRSAAIWDQRGPKIMVNKFNYGEYFRGSTVLGELLRTEENPSWLTRIPLDPPKTKNLVYLGCNVFKTVHLVETLCKILDNLNVDYKAVGGPAFCCGIVHRKVPSGMWLEFGVARSPVT
jgi:hypothetical protein